MAFCTRCGSRVAGRFCEGCGAPAPGGTPSAGGPAAAAAAPAPQQTAPQGRKVSPIVWILGGLAAVVLLFGAVLTIGGMFVLHKARQAGIDPELWARNPGIAATRMIAAANPDAEVVSVDENAGIIVVRDKKNGKVVRMNFADIKRGRMTIEADGESVSVGAIGDGSSGAVELQSKDGVARIGGGAAVKLPAWLPVYAGAKDPGGITSSSPQGEAGTYGFKTSDTPAAVVQFYRGAFEKAGFTVRSNIEAGNTTALAADSASEAVEVAASAEGGQTTVSVTFSPKNK